jgi:putative nucleotidyltransferase with HDIG domain
MIPKIFQITKFTQIFKKVFNQTPSIPGFAKKIAFKRWIIAICVSAVLAFLLTPQVHFFYPDYKVGSIAARDVRADRDFLVEDRLSTEQKRAEAIKDFKSVYDYDNDNPSYLRAAVTRAFSSAEQAYNPSSNRSLKQLSLKQLRNNFENSLGITLTDEEFYILQNYKFSPNLSDKISRLIASVYNSALITNVIFTKQDLGIGIVIRDIKNQKERVENNFSSIQYIDNIDSTLVKKVSNILDSESGDIKKVVVSLTKKLIQPNLTFNKNASERKKEIVLNNIKPVFFQVLKDEIIIREGEKISPIDQDKLEAFFTGTGEKSFSNTSILLGIFFLILTLSIVLSYLTRKSFQVEENLTDIIFLSVTIVFQIILVKGGIFMSEAINRAFPLFPTDSYYYAIPFAAGAMLVGILINRNVAFIFSIYSSILAALLFDGKIAIMLFSFLGCAAASYHIAYSKQRSAFFKVGLLLGGINCITILFLCLSSPSCTIFSATTIIKLAMGFMSGIFSAIIVAGMIPLFETIFNYTTDIKLLELANLNQPIFQRMIMEAPGTYHHSIIVSSLVEAAAEAIGANPLLAKVSAYYHDIGKIKKPLYFIENQRDAENKHNKLSPRMSSLIITAHVKDGCEIASKDNLGTQIVNIIREHHGTSLVSYFYEKAKRDRDSSIRALPESNFRYAGPKPQSREAGLVLLGDVIEASSRTLSNPTPSRIKNLVKERIEKVLMDGQLDECKLTLYDLNIIAENFTRILNGIFHQRIDYPETVVRDFNGSRKENNVYSHRKQAEKSKP